MPRPTRVLLPTLVFPLLFASLAACGAPQSTDPTRVPPTATDQAPAADPSTSATATPSPPAAADAESPTHGYTGVVFAPHPGNFTRGRTSTNDVQGYDALAAYRNDRNTHVTLYVYPLTVETDMCARSQQGDFDLSLSAMRARVGGDPVETAHTLHSPALPGDPALGAVLSNTRTQEDGTTITVEDRLYVFVRGGWFIKMRVTAYANQPGQNDDDLLAFLAGIPWPDFDALPVHSLTLDDVYGPAGRRSFCPISIK